MYSTTDYKLFNYYWLLAITYSLLSSQLFKKIGVISDDSLHFQVL